MTSSGRLVSMSFRRHLHLAPSLLGVEKSALAKLRKNTGYSFSRCKEALEKYNNDIKEAETWLRSEAQTHGWEKATKLQGRATAQGLISVLASPQNAVMLEVNCETDFVARNKKFQALVQKVTNACFADGEKKGEMSGPGGLFKSHLGENEVGALSLNGGLAIKDEIAVAIGDIGENIKGRRGLLFKAREPVVLAGYTHPATLEAEKQRIVQCGKFGAIVAYKMDNSKGSNAGRVAEIGRQLCQHIVGMNPTEIGSMDEPEPRRSGETPKSVPSPPTDSEGHDELEFKQDIKEEEDEKVLLNQEFLLDPELTVREFLVQNSVEVIDFVRFECGESVEK